MDSINLNKTVDKSFVIVTVENLVSWEEISNWNTKKILQNDFFFPSHFHFYHLDLRNLKFPDGS